LLQPLEATGAAAHREASFGHAILQLINTTTATFTWHRNQDGAMVVGDFATIVRDTVACPCACHCANLVVCDD
jgi:hypothetical protein